MCRRFDSGPGHHFFTFNTNRSCLFRILPQVDSAVFSAVVPRSKTNGLPRFGAAQSFRASARTLKKVCAHHPHLGHCSRRKVLGDMPINPLNHQRVPMPHSFGDRVGLDAVHDRTLGAIHPQGRATSSRSSGRALPACNTTPRTSVVLRFRESRSA